MEGQGEQRPLMGLLLSPLRSGGWAAGGPGSCLTLPVY